MFRAILEDVLRRVEGALMVSLMGTDGIPIEEVRREGAGDPANRDLIAAEYAALQKRIVKTHEGLELRRLREVAVVTEGLAMLLHMVGRDYFLLMMLSGTTGMGRARYELSKAHLKLQDEIP
ncbi:MAG: hypothetical protein U0166_19610 [Acidobacteriota bacterium]